MPALNIETEIDGLKEALLENHSNPLVAGNFILSLDLIHLSTPVPILPTDSFSVSKELKTLVA